MKNNIFIQKSYYSIQLHQKAAACLQLVLELVPGNHLLAQSQ